MIELTIHGFGSGVCSLSGKECEGVTVSFKDGTLTESFLSQKSFMQAGSDESSEGEGKRTGTRNRPWQQRRPVRMGLRSL